MFFQFFFSNFPLKKKTFLYNAGVQSRGLYVHLPYKSS